MPLSILDTSYAGDIADAVIGTLTDEGYTTEEIIAGLVQSIVDISAGDDSLLDAAANLLADGGVTF
jgi:hypothetical protein